MKIAIIGYSGSGKSTLSKVLAKYYNIPLIHLDTLKFLPNWIDRDKDEGREIVKEFMKNESWVIDGNYSYFFRERRLEESDKIIFMNFPRRICFPRAFNRYLKYRNQTRDDMAKGCVEKFDFKFAWWILHEGRTKELREDYKRIQEKYKDKVIVLKNSKEVDLLLQNINA